MEIKTLFKITISIMLFFACAYLALECCDTYSFLVGIVFAIALYAIWHNHIEWISVVNYLPFENEDNESEDVRIMLDNGTKCIGYYCYDTKVWYAYRRGKVSVVKWSEI